MVEIVDADHEEHKLDYQGNNDTKARGRTLPDPLDHQDGQGDLGPPVYVVHDRSAGPTIRIRHDCSDVDR
jgi:hypothetical protein